MLPEVGMLLRSYAKTSEQVDEVVARAIKSVQKVREVKLFGELCVKTIIIAIPEDYDCGLTSTALEKKLEEEGLIAEVYSFKGHHSCEVLNQGLQTLLDWRMDYGLIMSHKAIDYFSEATMSKVMLALYFGFKVVGVRISQLADVEEFPIENTFAVWKLLKKNIIEDISTFDSKIGVEEIAPIVRLIRYYGKCVAVVNAEGSLSIRESEDGKARHKEVRDTKRARQIAEAERLGATVEFIKENIVEL